MNAFVKWLWIGSSASKVTSVEVSDAPLDATAVRAGFIPLDESAADAHPQGSLAQRAPRRPVSGGCRRRSPCNRRPRPRRRHRRPSPEPPPGAAPAPAEVRPHRTRPPAPPWRARPRGSRGFTGTGTAASRRGWLRPTRWRSTPDWRFSRAGGKAVDAAVAVQAMLGLVEPQSSGVGGGAFLMYYDAHTGKVTALDGPREGPAGRATRHVPRRARQAAAVRRGGAQRPLHAACRASSPC